MNMELKYIILVDTNFYFTPMWFVNYINLLYYLPTRYQITLLKTHLIEKIFISSVPCILLLHQNRLRLVPV